MAKIRIIQALFAKDQDLVGKTLEMNANSGKVGKHRHPDFSARNENRPKGYIGKHGKAWLAAMPGNHR